MLVLVIVAILRRSGKRMVDVVYSLTRRSTFPCFEANRDMILITLGTRRTNLSC